MPDIINNLHILLKIFYDRVNIELLFSVNIHSFFGSFVHSFIHSVFPKIIFTKIL